MHQSKHQDLSGEEEPTYGFNFMFNPMIENEQEPNSSIGKNSDTSSGIHSASNSSITNSTLDKQERAKSNSLESLMQTLQQLEAAVTDKPKLRSLSSLQQSVNILNKFDKTTDQQKPSHVNLTSFMAENSIYGTKLDCQTHTKSKLIDFTQNVDYSKYYMPNMSTD